MSGVRTVIGANNELRKFLFWLRYDGSRFASMAKGGAPHLGPTVVQLFEACITQMLGHGVYTHSHAISRTDKKVHAVRCPLFVRVQEHGDWFSRTDTRAQFLRNFNQLISHTDYRNAFELLQIDPLAPGFHAQFHVAYRRYVYRLRRLNSPQGQGNFFTKLRPQESLRETRGEPSLADIAEFNYSWTVPPSFCLERANRVIARLRRPGQNIASFCNHRMRERQFETLNTTTRRQFMLLRITAGEPYSFPADDADFFNVEFVAPGFLREQIRRMVALIVHVACDERREDPGRLLDFLLTDPDPHKFYQARLQPAPPSGLFLADVVYDPRMYTDPVPEFYPPLRAEQVGCANEEGEEEEEENGREGAFASRC